MKTKLFHGKYPNPVQNKAVRVLIFNLGTQKREYKKFRSAEEADKFFENKKSKSNLVCEPKEKYFTYYTELGGKIMVQKMY